MHSDEIDRRKQLALNTIHDLLGTKEGEFGLKLFVSHHLDELDGSYWELYLGVSSPNPRQVLNLLELIPVEENGFEEGDAAFDSLDFTLPGGATNYLLCVTFDANGEVENVVMES